MQCLSSYCFSMCSFFTVSEGKTRHPCILLKILNTRDNVHSNLGMKFLNQSDTCIPWNLLVYPPSLATPEAEPLTLQSAEAVPVPSHWHGANWNTRDRDLHPSDPWRLVFLIRMDISWLSCGKANAINHPPNHRFYGCYKPSLNGRFRLWRRRSPKL